MKYINQFCRFSVGVLFLFSGLIKLNDPVGTSIKLEEYFEVFATDFSPLFQKLVPYSLSLAVFLIVLEVVLGVAVLIHYRMRLTAWLLLITILFFTSLTFYSAYFNKVTDCGCFGDAIKLTPWTSFIKDCVLLLLILVLFVQRRTFTARYQPLSANIIMSLILLFTLYMAYFTINHLSFFDFRAYKTGADIARLMKPSAPLRYNYIFTKNGEEAAFSTFPADTSYKYKSMEILNRNDLPKITDYAVWNDEGNFTQESLTGKKLLILIQDADKASAKNIEKIKTLARELENKGILCWILTSSDHTAISTFRNEHQVSVPVYYADATVIKTMIRSNPGLMLLQNGIVRGKWHHKDCPQVNEVLPLFK